MGHFYFSYSIRQCISPFDFRANTGYAYFSLYSKRAPISIDTNLSPTVEERMTCQMKCYDCNRLGSPLFLFVSLKSDFSSCVDKKGLLIMLPVKLNVFKVTLWFASEKNFTTASLPICVRHTM